MDIGGKCGRFFLIGINLLFLILGLALLIVGIVMKTDLVNQVVDKDEIVQTMNEVGLSGDLKLGNLFSSLSIMIICIGAFVLGIAALGVFGTCCLDRCLLFLYAVVVILIFIVQVAGVALWITMKNKFETTVREKLSESMKQYEGYTSINQMSVGWDLLFIGFDCCGVDSVENNQDEFNETLWWASKPAGDFIPYSCCESATEDNYRNVSAGSGEAACTQLTSGYQLRGCYQAFKDFLQKYESGAIGLGITLLTIEFIAAVFALTLCRAIGRGEVV